jgi:uncharacterized protein (TIGR03437 family)
MVPSDTCVSGHKAGAQLSADRDASYRGLEGLALAPAKYNKSMLFTARSFSRNTHAQRSLAGRTTRRFLAVWQGRAGPGRAFTWVVFLGSALVPACRPASLGYSTYLKDGFTPRAMASDAAGNLYLAGSAVTDPVSGATGAVVAKLDPQAGTFLYFAYLDGAASDTVGAITVDSAGNAYVAGSTVNPGFSQTGGPATGGQLGTSPTGSKDPRAFLTKLSPSGTVMFSVLVGGSASSTVEAIALTPQGQILMSGVANSSGFPVTSGAYAVPDSNLHPFLMELDAAASTMIFSATGIGGSSIALDGAGNIYVSGSTTLLDYPTTVGAYQTTFTPSYVCSFLCQTGFAGGQQYLSKVDPSGSKLIYSTGINGAMAYRSASTQNTGLAVDAAGNVYVTGVLDGGPYPFTVQPPSNAPYEFGFLTKLDPAGANVLYSIPVGGGGVQVDASGAVYVAGTVTGFNPGLDPPRTAVAVPSQLAWVPSQCLPNNITATNEVYVMKLDPASGAVVDTQWIDGSAVVASMMTLGSGKVWISGATQLADVPITPAALTPAKLVPGVLPGAYLSAVDFSQPSAALSRAPQIACVVDGGNLMHAGPVAANQLLTLFGVNLGPGTGIAAPDGLDGEIAGVSVTFDGTPAELLYVSSSQINILTPANLPQTSVTVMQVSVNGVTSSPRQLPVTGSNPNLLAEVAQTATDCSGGAQGLILIATNADGSRNSCTNPAKLGSIISFYVHGTGVPFGTCFCFDETLGNASAAVVNVSDVNTFLTRVDVQLPTSFATARATFASVGAFEPGLRMYRTPVGPVTLPNSDVISVTGALNVWATQ